MKRREAIRRAAWAMGGTLSAPAIMGILKGCKATPDVGWEPTLFSKEQALVVSRMADVIIPRTDTPGAVDAGVPPFIERMVKDVYAEDERNRFMAAVDSFNLGARQDYGEKFIDLNEADQEACIRGAHDAARRADSPRGEQPFIMKVKELTLLGFFTSEPGATQVLQYDAVPGAYVGCQPLSEVGRTWAT